jgi:hypothetical protein
MHIRNSAKTKAIPGTGRNDELNRPTQGKLNGNLLRLPGEIAFSSAPGCVFTHLRFRRWGFSPGDRAKAEACDQP